MTKTIIDLKLSDEDQDLLTIGWLPQYNKKAHGEKVYFYRRWPQKTFLHRVIAARVHGPIPKGMVVDHINGDELDNRRENLRVVTQQENIKNSTFKQYEIQHYQFKKATEDTHVLAGVPSQDS